MGFFKEAISDGSPSRTIARLHTVIWALIYAGLLLLVFGIVMQRSGSAVTGWLLIGVGMVAAAAGFVLIWVRSRMGQREQQP